MIEVTGLHNCAKCFCETIEGTAREQIQAVCDREEFANSKIRIMPDVHAGKGCTIGTTMTITDKIVPGMVGVDIGMWHGKPLASRRRRLTLLSWIQVIRE